MLKLMSGGHWNIFFMNNQFNFLLIAAVATLLFPAGCWETVDHVYDEGDPLPTDTETDTGQVEDTGEDTDSSTSSERVNSALSPGWEGFGAPCMTDEDCVGYPAANPICIPNSVMGMINVPGGYCSACCDQENIRDACAPGIDCVGADNAYLVCLARCNTDADCRVEDNYECRTIYYLDGILLDTYCLPDEEHSIPESTVLDFPSCPWPWVE
jgi:hypothetical protein